MYVEIGLYNVDCYELVDDCEIMELEQVIEIDVFGGGDLLYLSSLFVQCLVFLVGLDWCM